MVFSVQRKCEQYWGENIGAEYQTPNKKISVTTTSVMPFADFVIRTFSVKSVSWEAIIYGRKENTTLTAVNSLELLTNRKNA